MWLTTTDTQIRLTKQFLIWRGRLTASADELQVPTSGYVTVQPTAMGGPGIAETYKSQQSQGLGITLIIIAVMAIIFNIVGIAIDDPFAYSGHGFWPSILVNTMHNVLQNFCARFGTELIETHNVTTLSKVIYSLFNFGRFENLIK